MQIPKTAVSLIEWFELKTHIDRILFSIFFARITRATVCTLLPRTDHHPFSQYRHSKDFQSSLSLSLSFPHLFLSSLTKQHLLS